MIGLDTQGEDMMLNERTWWPMSGLTGQERKQKFLNILIILIICSLSRHLYFDKNMHSMVFIRRKISLSQRNNHGDPWIF